MNDASGKPVNDHGKYVEVWEKQADGKWKCGTDIWNSDLPVPARRSRCRPSQKSVYNGIRRPNRFNGDWRLNY